MNTIEEKMNAIKAEVKTEERKGELARERAEMLKTTYAEQGRDLLRDQAAFEEVEAAWNDADSHYSRARELNADMVKVAAGAPKENTAEHRFAVPSTTEYRALLESGSGASIAPPAFASNFYDRLRARNVVLAAFASKASGNVIAIEGNRELNLPKIGTSSTAGFVAEAAEITLSDIGLELVTLTPRKLAVLVEASNELFADSMPAAREVIAFDLVRETANALDLGLLEGSGTAPVPRGFRNFTGAQTVELGAGNGATPTLDDVKSAVDAVEAANGNPASTVVFMANRTWSTLTGEKDLDERYQLSPDPSRESRRWLFDREVFTSTQIALDETVGTSSDCSYFVVADLEQVAVGRRQDVTLAYNPCSKFGSDVTQVRGTSRWDIQPLNDAAVHVTTGVRP